VINGVMTIQFAFVVTKQHRQPATLLVVEKLHHFRQVVHLHGHGQLIFGLPGVVQHDARKCLIQRGETTLTKFFVKHAQTLFNHAASKETNAKNAKPNPAQVMRGVISRRRRAMLFSNSAITRTPTTSLTMAITSASSSPPAVKVSICPHGINTPTNICSTTSCFRLIPHFMTPKPLPLYSESGPSCNSCSASARSNGSLPISIKVANEQARSEERR